jgi:uncharacterized damage-inducible protein DinB
LRAAALEARLRAAAEELIAVIAPIEGGQWSQVTTPGIWSIGKDAEHVADAALYHQWIVRLTIGERVSSRRPAIERMKLTTDLSPPEAVKLIRQRTEESASLIRGLMDEMLDLVTRPPRAKGQRLAETIEGVLIAHYDVHRTEIAEKLNRA